MLVLGLRAQDTAVMPAARRVERMTTRSCEQGPPVVAELGSPTRLLAPLPTWASGMSTTWPTNGRHTVSAPGQDIGSASGSQTRKLVPTITCVHFPRRRQSPADVMRTLHTGFVRLTLMYIFELAFLGPQVSHARSTASQYSLPSASTVTMSTSLAICSVRNISPGGAGIVYMLPDDAFCLGHCSSLRPNGSRPPEPRLRRGQGFVVTASSRTRHRRAAERRLGSRRS
jgi:hypothetical protein